MGSAGAQNGKHRLEIKIPPELFAEVKAAAKSRGFSSANAFVRAAIVSELRSGPTALDRAEENIAASVDRLAKEMRAFQNAQQALFALTDSFARLFLTCIPEPPAEMLEQAKARARLRYERLMLAAAQGMKQRD